jgi:1-acyl-sn-glycerol-3-phosphate acyltransferase
MIAWLRFAFTIVRVFAHVALALAVVASMFPWMRLPAQQRFIRWWSGRLLAILGLQLRVSGPSSTANAALIDEAMRIRGRGAMLVLNHISWLDIFIVHSLRPAHFIAKAEISRWPLLGFLVDRTGAIFIERGKRHAVREVNHRVATMLTEGELVGMFPEGTTGDGNRLLPFHANLIQPAINAGAPIIVAGIRYREIRGGRTNATLYTGDISMLQSLLRLARHGPIVAEFHLIDALDSAQATRHEIARAARALVGAALDFDDDAHEAAEGLSTVIVVDDLRISAEPGPADRRLETQFDPRDELL